MNLPRQVGNCCAAGEVRAQDRLVRRALALGAGDVAAGDDRRRAAAPSPRPRSRPQRARAVDRRRALGPGRATRRSVISRPSSSIASPRWAATKAECRPCSTVRPPSAACARTRTAAATEPRTSQRVIAKAPERLQGERRDQHDHDRRRGAVAELDHRVLLQERQHAAAAQRPALGAAACRAAAEAGVADPNDPADHDQGEGGEDRRVQQAAEASELVRFATSGGQAATELRSGYRRAFGGVRR